MKNKLFSIVIPFHNEQGNIENLLNEFNKYINLYDFELILVNDGSSDSTHTIFHKLSQEAAYKKYINFISYKKNKGYGGAILEGLKSAKGEVLGWMHSDLQTDVKYIFEAYKNFIDSSREKLLIKGTRKNRRLSQVLFSNSMAIITSIIFCKVLYEINAQPKVFPRELYSCFNNPPQDFSLDLYLLVLAKKNNYKIESIPVNFIDRVYGESKWAYSFKSKIKTISRTLKYIIKLRIGKN